MYFSNLKFWKFNELWLYCICWASLAFSCFSFSSEEPVWSLTHELKWHNLYNKKIFNLRTCSRSERLTQQYKFERFVQVIFACIEQEGFVSYIDRKKYFDVLVDFGWNIHILYGDIKCQSCEETLRSVHVNVLKFEQEKYSYFFCLSDFH